MLMALVALLYFRRRRKDEFRRNSMTTHPMPWRALFVLVPAIFGLALYANLELAVNDSAYFEYFPPFKAHFNANTNNRMGGEFFNIAWSLYQGKGFADPFGRSTGPTAWQPPLYPLFMAGLLWLFDGNRDYLMAVTIFLQVYTLIATGLIVVALAEQSEFGKRRGVSPPVLALIIYVAVVLWNFNLCFQITRDSWLVMLSLDIIIAGLCWWRPLSSKKRAAPLGACRRLHRDGQSDCWPYLGDANAFRRCAAARLVQIILGRCDHYSRADAVDHPQLPRLRPVYTNQVQRRFGALSIAMSANRRRDFQFRRPSVWQLQGRECLQFA